MKRKTIMVRCPFLDCYELMPEGAKGCCKAHEPVAETRRCATCGDPIAGANNTLYCEPCKVTNRLNANKKHGTESTGYAQIEVATPKRRKPVEIVKTSEQVDRECRKEEKRLREVLLTLDPRLLALRNCRGAVAVVGLERLDQSLLSQQTKSCDINA